MTATSNSRVASLSHIPALDGIRGLAILLVIPHNTDILSDSTPGLLSKAASFGMNIGWIGVQLFFVLSGFLITRILISTRNRPGYFKNFYIKRSLRILPLYILCIALILYALPWLGVIPAKHEQDISKQIWLWLFLSNWSEFHVDGGSSFPHFWSLAVEEQFYWIWPLILWKLDPKRVLNVSITLIITSIAARYILVTRGLHPDMIYTSTLSRMDALAMGSALAALTLIPEISARLTTMKVSILWGAAFSLLALFLVIPGGYQRVSAGGQIAGYTIWGAFFTLVVAGAIAPMASRARFVLESPVVRTMGKYSFCMYLIHKPIHDLVGKPWLTTHGYTTTENGLPIAIAYTTCVLLASFVIAALSYHGYEKHFLALKDRLSS